MTSICQTCGAAQATVHWTNIIGAEKEERHLCGQCAEADLGFSKSKQARLKEAFKGMKPKLDEEQDD